MAGTVEQYRKVLRAQGLSEDEIEQVMRRRGITPSVELAQDLKDNPPVEMSEREKLVYWQANKLKDQRGYGDVEMWAGAVRNSAAQVSEFLPEMETFKDRQSASFVRTVNDVGILGETVLGLASLSFRPQQGLFAAIKTTAESVTERRSGEHRALPEAHSTKYFADNFNTKLNKEQESRFQGWLDVMSTRLGRDVSKDLQAYDLRGLFLDSANRPEFEDGGHGPDLYKKPNHPTFSDESVYHNTKSPKGGRFVGGHWEGETYIPPKDVSKAGLVSFPDWGEVASAVKVALLPEVYDESVVGDTTAFTEAINKAGDFLTSRNLFAGQSARDVAMEAFQHNPKIIEQFRNNIAFNEVLDAIFSQGRIDDMLSTMDSNGIPNFIDIGIWTSLDLAGEVFVDPLFGANDAPKAVDMMSRVVLGTERAAARSLRSAPMSVTKAARAEKDAAKFVEQARRVVASNPNDKAAAKALYRAEQMHSKVNDVLEGMKGAGYKRTDIRLGKNARKPRAVIEDEIRADGILTGKAQFADAVGGKSMSFEDELAEAAAQAQMDATRLDALLKNAAPDQIERLTKSRDEALARLAKIQRAEDRLAANLRKHENWPGFGPDEYADYNRRLMSGPSDGEQISDAIEAMAHGADADDVTLNNLMFPEYDVYRLDVPHPDSGLGLRAVDPEKMTAAEVKMRVDIDEFLPGYSSRKDWFDGPKYNKFLRTFRSVADRGLAEGSILPRAANMLDRSIFWLREPMRALQRKAPLIFERMRTGQSKYDVETTAAFHWMENLFEKTGIGKRGKLGFKVTDDKKSELLFDILNTSPSDDPQKLARLLAQADEPMRAAASELRTYMNWLASRQGIAGDQFIEGYIHHVFDHSWLRPGKWRPLELMGMGRNQEIMAQHLLERKGHLGYKRNVVEAMETMTRAAHRKLIIQPMLEDMVSMGAKVGGNVDGYTRMLTDVLKGKPGTMRNLFNLATGGRWDRIDAKLGALSGAFYTGILTGNAKYIMENWATAAVTTTARYGIGRTLRGLLRTMTPEGRRIAEHAGVQKIWKTLFESPQMQKYQELLQGVPLLGLNRMEFTIRGMTFWAALDETMAELGIKHFDELVESGLANRAIYDAVRRTESLNHFYGVAGRSPIFTHIMPGPGASQSAMQFLSFGPKQVEELAAQTMENPGYFLRYMAMSGIMTRVAANTFGINTEENIGLGFVGPSVEALKRGGGPAVQFFREAGLFARNLDRSDLVAAKENFNRVLDTAQRALPLATMVRNTMMMASELHTGQKVSPETGEFIRDLSLGGGGKYDERLATALQLPSVNDRLQRQFDEAARRNMAKPLFEQREALLEYKRALNGDDSNALPRAIERLAAMGIPFDPSGSVDDVDFRLRYIDRATRTLLEDPLIHGGNYDLLLTHPLMYGN